MDYYFLGEISFFFSLEFLQCFILQEKEIWQLIFYPYVAYFHPQIEQLTSHILQQWDTQTWNPPLRREIKQKVSSVGGINHKWYNSRFEMSPQDI